MQISESAPWKMVDALWRRLMRLCSATHSSDSTTPAIQTDVPKLNFWWEWQSASPFWPANDAAVQIFGLGEIDADRLGLPADLVKRLKVTGAWHDTALNWLYPPDPGPWRQEECDRFNTASKELFDECKNVFGGRFEISYIHRDEMEDPDLDAYLISPKSFRIKHQPDSETQHE